LTGRGKKKGHLFKTDRGLSSQMQQGGGRPEKEGEKNLPVRRGRPSFMRARKPFPEKVVECQADPLLRKNPPMKGGGEGWIKSKKEAKAQV